MRIIDNALLAEFRSVRACELCGKTLWRNAVPHHVLARGMGAGARVDHRINLVALGDDFSCPCHRARHAQGKFTQRLLELVAVRERVTVADIQELMAWLRRLGHKGPRPTQAEALAMLAEKVEERRRALLER